MKKLIVLLVVIAFCFSSCDVLYPMLEDIVGGNTPDEDERPNEDELPDDGDDPDDGKNPTDTHRHSYTSVKTTPTCTTEGYITYSCECGYGYVTEKTPALGHDYLGGVCSVCKETDPSVGGDNTHKHSYTSERTYPTCTE